MILQSRFGAAQTGVGYQFYSAAGTLLGSRITSGIAALPEAGSYIADATVPTDAVGVYWSTDQAEASAALPEAGDYPTVEEIIAAAGGITAETAAALEAAEQILLVSPYVPDESPALIIPAPDADESLSVVYVYSESITNEKRAGIEIVLKLVTTPAKSERVLEIAPKTMTTDAAGFAQITVQRGQRYRVTSRELALNTIIEPTTETFNLLTIIP
jgi:hypothetical protein